MDFSLEKIKESGVAIRNNVAELEKAMLSEEQVDCPVYHHFSPGIYMREVHIKAGVFAIGHRQKTKHLNIFIRGKVNYVNDDGSTELLSAPMIFTSDPGRKIGLVLEDMVWLNAYSTDETDIEKLEETYLDKSDYFQSVQKNEPRRQADIDDFHRMIEEYGLNAENIRSESERTEDLVPFPDGTYTVGVFDSNIEGKGLFTMSPIEAGSIVAHGRIKGKRTPAGRYVNHSVKPNATLKQFGDDVFFVSLTKIEGCKGGQMGEEITIDYREALKLKR